MKLIKLMVKFMQLSFRDKILCLVTLALLGVCRGLIIVLPFKWVIYLVGGKLEIPASFTIDILQNQVFKESINNVELILKRVGNIVETVARYTPWNSTCLVQALVAKIILRYYAIYDGKLYFGVKVKSSDMSDGMVESANIVMAHAWLVSNGVIVVGAKGFEPFRVILLYH